jgi:hypothetical protein
MMVTKAKAAEAVPHQPADVSPGASVGTPLHSSPAFLGTKALTVKLEGALYARLVQLAHERHLESGRRVTHQEIMVEGLLALLEKAGR